MPSLQEIERFKTILNSLGSEAEILAERGESIEDLPPPESGPPDLGDLFAGPALEPREASAEAAEPAGPAAEEFALDMPPPEGEGEGAAPEVSEDLDKVFASLGLGEAEQPFPPEPAETFPPIELGEAAEGAEAETAKALEEFGIPPGLLDSLGEPAAAEAGEAAPEPEPESEAPPGPSEPAAEEEVADFTLPADFGVHEEAVPEGEAAEAAGEAEAPGAGEAPFEVPPAEGLGEEPFQLPEEFLAPPSAGEALAAEAAGEAAGAEAPAEALAEEAALAFPEMPAVGGEVGGKAAEGAAEGLAGLPEEFTDEGLFAGEGAAEAPAEAPIEAPPEEAEAPVGPVPAVGEEEFGISERRFAALGRTLAALPRNLKIAIEELIAEKGLTGPDLRLLTDLLADGAAPARLAAEVSRITGRSIRLPRGYEKLTGQAFEEERRRFGFAFRENVWPVVRAAFLSLLFLGLLSLGGYWYIYRPVAAYAIYRQGHSQIQKERYKLAEERFAKANAILKYKRWYLRYAAAYTEKRQYPLAADKYELLLRHFPLDRQGTLAYAQLLTYSTFGYERADRVLGEYTGDYPVEGPRKRNVPRAGFRDAAILLARGDNYLEWAEEKPEHFENARVQYASILDYYGERDEVLLRMMRYFIRVSRSPGEKLRLRETQDLYKLLEAKDKRQRLEVDPKRFASVYSELAGFWFDQKAYDGVREALLAALKRDKFHPEAHYQLARYYRYLPDPGEERKALVNAIELLDKSSPFTRLRLLALIDSYNRLGELYWRDREYLNAEKYYQLAIQRIEAGQAQRVLGQVRDLGLPYKNRGDIYYYISRDLDTALELYREAERNQYRSDELDYKIGYIAYAQEDYEQALLRFSKVVDARPTGENGLFALANALYLQGYYSSAQGYYLRLLDIQEARRDRIPDLRPADNSEHRALLEYLMKAYNNLGVTTMRVSERGRDPARQARALANLTFSSEHYDALTRNPDTGERSETRNLAYLNQRSILYPTRTVELEIYGRLPLDLAATRF